MDSRMPSSTFFTLGSAESGMAETASTAPAQPGTSGGESPQAS
jgi:hypothetical protein